MTGRVARRGRNVSHGRVRTYSRRDVKHELKVWHVNVPSFRAISAGSLPDWERLPGPQLGQRNPAYLVRSRKGAVATEVKECSEIGVESEPHPWVSLRVSLRGRVSLRRSLG